MTHQHGNNVSMEKKKQQKIIPSLWFNKEAEEAVDFYTKIFNEGKVQKISHYTEVGRTMHGMEVGTVMTIEFSIENIRFIALNGGPHFTFSPALSFTLSCPSKEEVTELWEKLSKGGTALMPLGSYPFSERYGWIQDRYGVSWQVLYTDKKKERTLIPSLLFTGTLYGKAEEAINFYTSTFGRNSRVGDTVRYGANQSPNTRGTLMYADFTLAGQTFSAMDSAYKHDFSFNEAISFMVCCETQGEIDSFWEKLSAVPQAEQCGWLKDRYGLSWQIVPRVLDEMLTSSARRKADRVMGALLEMKKLNITKLEEAFIRN